MDAPDLQDFAASQFTATAYAARQVVEYLRSALYGELEDGADRVLVCPGWMTSVLRRDWGLFFEGYLEKTRDDHRHHALDATIIACCDHARSFALANARKEQLLVKEKTGITPPRTPLSPPWGPDELFRQYVLEKVAELNVCHRPVKRGLRGALHEETLYGVVDEEKGLFVTRIYVEDLKPGHLQSPKAKRKKNGEVTGWSTGKGGVVRDAAMRKYIRNCLTEAGLNPDTFDPTKKPYKDFLKTKGIRQPNGMPVKRIRIIRSMNHMVVIRQKNGVVRAYTGGNNHHMALFENPKTGACKGYVERMFDTARRLKVNPMEGAVDLADKGKLKFKMSLSEGETVRAEMPLDSNGPSISGLFVVEKVESGKVFFAECCDARQVEEKRRWHLSPKSFQEMAKNGQPVQKVAVGTLGEVTVLHRD